MCCSPAALVLRGVFPSLGAAVTPCFPEGLVYQAPGRTGFAFGFELAAVSSPLFWNLGWKELFCLHLSLHSLAFNSNLHCPSLAESSMSHPSKNSSPVLKVAVSPAPLCLGSAPSAHGSSQQRFTTVFSSVFPLPLTLALFPIGLCL